MSGSNQNTVGTPSERRNLELYPSRPNRKLHECSQLLSKHPLLQSIDRDSALDSQSSMIISTLATNGGWGTGLLKIDFSLDVDYTDSNTVTVPFQDQGVYLPDSDVPANMPAPPGTSTDGF